MTISTSTNAITFPGNGTQTVFDFDFVGGNASYIVATTVSAAGVSEVLALSDYTLSLNPPAPGAIWGAGGSIAYPLVGSPLPAGATLTIERIVPEVQGVSLSNQGSQTPQSTEMGLDLLEMQIQQVSENSVYAFTAPVTDGAPPVPAPPASVRANQAAIFDGDGNLTAGVAPASGIISSAMQPVIDAATVALGRTALGLGALATEGFGPGLSDDGAGNARMNQVVTVDASNQAVTSAFAWALRVASVSVIYTFPAGNTLWNGFTTTIDAMSGNATLAIAANDAFSGQSSGAAFLVPQGYIATVTCDGATNSTWYVRLSLAIALNGANLAYPGQVSMSAGNAIPAGWLQNNGQAVSRTTFSALFAAIGTTYGAGDGVTTFNVPNDQGRFWRSWNGTGSGIDNSRVFGSFQPDTFQGHFHGLSDAWTNPGTGNNVGSGSFTCVALAFSTGAPITDGTNGAPRTGTETRPSNVAYLSLIKY